MGKKKLKNGIVKRSKNIENESHIPYVFEMICPSDIIVDENYQRDLKENEVRKIVSRWDDNQVDPVKVNRREDGKYYAFDGQHRLSGWKIVHGNEPIPCLVYNLVSNKKEALLYTLSNTNFKRPKPGDITKANVFVGNPEDVAYKNMLDETGTPFKWAQDGTNSKYLTCHAFMKKKIRQVGIDNVRKAMVIIQDAELSSEPSIAYKGVFIDGIVDFVLTYRDEIDNEYLIKKLKKAGALGIKNKADHYLKLAGLQRWGRSENGKYVARGIVDIYNENLRNSRLRHKLDANKVIMGYAPEDTTEDAVSTEPQKTQTSVKKEVKTEVPFKQNDLDNMDIKNIISNSFRRSDFQDYLKVSDINSYLHDKYGIFTTQRFCESILKDLGYQTKTMYLNDAWEMRVYGIAPKSQVYKEFPDFNAF